MIAVIGAMKEEIALFKRDMNVEKTLSMAGLKFFVGIFEGKKIVLVKCGVGKVNAASCTQLLIDSFNPLEAMLFVGVGGALREELQIGDVIISVDLVQHDVDARSVGFRLGEVPLSGKRFFKTDKKLLKKAFDLRKKFSFKAVKGRILSGDQFIHEKERFKELRKAFKGDLIEMEGAAFAQVCEANKIPFLVIRSVSDLVGGKPKKEFWDNLKKASRNSFLFSRELIKEL